jgi:hypothetical protein
MNDPNAIRIPRSLVELGPHHKVRVPKGAIPGLNFGLLTTGNGLLYSTVQQVGESRDLKSDRNATITRHGNPILR